MTDQPSPNTAHSSAAFRVPRFLPPSFQINCERQHMLVNPDFLHVGITIYVCLENGQSFWFVPTFIDQCQLCGFVAYGDIWALMAFLKSEIKGFY